MAKSTSLFRCSTDDCDYTYPKWFGRCPKCNEFSTAVEEAVTPVAALRRGSTALDVPAATAVSLREVNPLEVERVDTGISELNRVLGGGIVPGSLILIGGEPGIGKTTVTTQLQIALARAQIRSLLVSGEESKEQAKMRFDRIAGEDGYPDLVEVTTDTVVERVGKLIEATGPDVVIVDSIQTAVSEQNTSIAGSISQVRDSAEVLRRTAKDSGTTIILVGQVTKDGDIAGPRILEHMVDAYLHFEGDRSDQYRILRAVKNRFGSTDEIGVFEMTGHGLDPVPDPSAIFTADRDPSMPGSAIGCVIEGSRPVLCEVQALVVPSGAPNPTRVSNGIDRGRLQMLLGVLMRKAGYRQLAMCDVYVSVTGGLSVNEPALDLTAASAIISALLDRPVREDFCAFGEVSLQGRVRRDPSAERRRKEAGRQGFARFARPDRISDVLEEALCPAGTEATL